jgi:hypothetical protein
VGHTTKHIPRIEVSLPSQKNLCLMRLISSIAHTGSWFAMSIYIGMVESMD